MLKNEKIQVSISYRNITHYIKLGYNPILDEYLEIFTEHLPSSSHVKVDVFCSICGRVSELMYCKYIENKKRHGFYGCKKCSRQKAAITSIDKYGVDNYSKTEEFKIRTEKTFMEKYGFKTNLLTSEHKEYTKKYLEENYNVSNFYDIRRKSNKKRFKLIQNIHDLIVKEFELIESKYNEDIINESYLLYRNECRRLTKRNIKKLFENWDGTDFYDGERIEDYFSLDHNDKRYPTIDHKTSVYCGFKNSIDPADIGSVENLCITKRGINSSKREMNAEGFRKVQK